MKAIIFMQESAANTALATCTSDIEQGEIKQEGTGRFVAPEPGRPYTLIIKHPTEAKWALVADEQVEAVLGETAVELSSSWFPARLFGVHVNGSNNGT